jgi:hypothetical protein
VALATKYLKKKLVSQSLEELLVAVVALMLLEPEVSILVGLEVGLGPEAPPAQVADMRLLLGVHAHVGLQRASCNQKQNVLSLGHTKRKNFTDCSGIFYAARDPAHI